jgi:hypothetical protein
MSKLRCWRPTLSSISHGPSSGCGGADAPFLLPRPAVVATRRVKSACCARGGSTPGRPRRCYAAVRYYCGWRWFLARWCLPSPHRHGSMVEGRSLLGRCFAPRLARIGRFSPTACSVAPSGPQGCRATAPTASIMSSQLFSQCSTPSSLFPVGGAGAASKAWRRAHGRDRVLV